MRLTIENGSFSYADQLILYNLNLKVNEGELVTILGANGIGKTTLVRCMLGFNLWSKGRTLLDNQPVNKINQNLFWKSISYVPQTKIISFDYSVESTVLMGRNPFINFFGKPLKQDLKEVEEVLRALDILNLKDKTMNQLSGGEKQMVLIARALVSKPKIIILDEPELNLDLANQDRIYRTLKKLVDTQNISCIVNTHHPFNAVKYSDYSLLLKKDGSYLYGKTRKILNKKNIIEIFDLPKDYYDTYLTLKEGEYNEKCLGISSDSTSIQRSSAIVNRN